MTEVCFNDSVKGALLLAQNCKNNSIGGALSVITDTKGLFSCFTKRKALKEFKKRQRELQKQAVSLGGKREEVLGISFGLSVGDIKSPIAFEACPRKEYIHSVFSFDRYNERAWDIEQYIDEKREYN